MISIGMDIQSRTIRCVNLTGTKTSGTLTPLNSISLPESESDGIQQLLLLKEMVRQLIVSVKADAVVIIRASQSCSVDRIKIECMIQIAAVESKVVYILCAVQTVRNFQKRKIQSEIGKSFESAFNAGATITPKNISDAAYCAWAAFK